MSISPFLFFFPLLNLIFRFLLKSFLNAKNVAVCNTSFSLYMISKEKDLPHTSTLKISKQCNCNSILFPLRKCEDAAMCTAKENKNSNNFVENIFAKRIYDTFRCSVMLMLLSQYYFHILFKCMQEGGGRNDGIDGGS